MQIFVEQFFHHKTLLLILQKGVTEAFDKEFGTVRSTILSLQFLDKLQQLHLPAANMTEKHHQVLRHFRHELDEVRLLFKKQKLDPPIAKNFSPVAGKVVNYASDCHYCYTFIALHYSFKLWDLKKSHYGNN